MAKEYLEKLSAFIEKATSDFSENVNLECKHFFSGVALYAEERICISLTPVGLAIKLPEETKDKLLKNKKNVPLRYFPKGPVKKGYVLFPGSIAKGGKTLHKYVKEIIEYVFIIPKTKKKQKWPKSHITRQIHSGVKKRRSFLALLFAAGDLQRSPLC